MASPECTCAHLSRVKNVNNSSILQPRSREKLDALCSSGISPLSALLFLAEGQVRAGRQAGSLRWCLGSGKLSSSKGACFSCSVQAGAIGAHPGTRETLGLCQVCGAELSSLLLPQIAVFSHEVRLTFPCLTFPSRQVHSAEKCKEIRTLRAKKR